MDDPTFLFLSDQIDSVQSRIPGFPLNLNCKLALDAILNRLNALVLTHQISAEQIRQFSEIHRLAERQEYQEIAALVGRLDILQDSEQSSSVLEIAPSVGLSEINSAGPESRPLPTLCSVVLARPQAFKDDAHKIEQPGATQIICKQPQVCSASVLDSQVRESRRVAGGGSAGANAAVQCIQSQIVELRHQMKQLNVTSQQLTALCECAESHCRIASFQSSETSAEQGQYLSMELAAALNSMLRLALVRSEQAIIRKYLVIFDFYVLHAVIYRAPVRSDPQINATISRDLEAATEINAALRMKLESLNAEQRNPQDSQRAESRISPANTVELAGPLENDHFAAYTVCVRPSPGVKRNYPHAKALRFDGLRQEMNLVDQPAGDTVPERAAGLQAPTRQDTDNGSLKSSARQLNVQARPRTARRYTFRGADALAKSATQQLISVLGIILEALESPGSDSAFPADPQAYELFSGLLAEARAAKDLKPSLLQIERLAAQLQTFSAAISGVADAQGLVKALAVSGRRNKQRYTPALQRVCSYTLECICRHASSQQARQAGEAQQATVRVRAYARTDSAQKQISKARAEKSSPPRQTQPHKAPQSKASPSVATPSLQRHPTAQRAVSPKELRVSVVEKRKSPQAVAYISKFGVLSVRSSTAAQTTDAEQSGDRSNASVQTKREIELESKDVQTEVLRKRPHLGAFCRKLARDFYISVNKRGIAWAAAEYPPVVAVGKYREISIK